MSENPKSDQKAARELLEALKQFGEATEKLMQDNVDLGKVVGTRSEATPDSLMIATLAAQNIQITKLLTTIGTIVTSHLIRVAHGEDAPPTM